jgi:asparagine synthase (glutamine-hydrolysing)
MCGIVGIRRFDGQPVDERVLAAMAATLDHRGPDGSGVWTDGDIGFGHRRLSIIDVDGSPQPMASSDGRLHVTFNGEILNYRELRSAVPYAYRTRGDTEVLLPLFDHDGPAGARRLRGQFAYAIADDRDSSLWLFRDRLGILPLYYWHDNNVFAFASEIKALAPALPRPFEVDEASLDTYLLHRSVPAPATLFRGVRKVQPGHWLRVDRDGSILEAPYWVIPQEGAWWVTDERAIEKVHEGLEQSVAEAMTADVPVGAYLSGGVDSSLIVALMKRARDGAVVDTFSAGFRDAGIDELPYARRVSTLLGTRHHEVVVSPEDFEASWPTLTWHRDAPISEPADVAVVRLAALARDHVKVVLSGEGSDELFGGYPKYRAARWTHAADVVPHSLRGPAFDVLEHRLPRWASRARVAVRAMAATPEEQIESWFSPFTAPERTALLGAGAARAAPGPKAPAMYDALGRMLWNDCHAWLADNLLERGDRMTMAASVELRPPFLDHRLVETAFALPSRMKVRGRQSKWVLKEVARQYLPEEIVDRRKVGFRVPLDRWFRSGLRDMAHDLLLRPSSFVTSALDREEVVQLLARHEQGRSNEEMRIFPLLALEVWHDVFFGPSYQANRPALLTTRAHVGLGSAST